MKKSHVFVRVINMSRRATGRKHENTVAKIYESRGYAVERARASATYIPQLKRIVSVPHDFFGVFDLIAVSPEGQIKFIQVTADSKIQKRIETMKNVTQIPDNLKFLVVWRKSRKVYSEINIDGFVVDEYKSSGNSPPEKNTTTRGYFVCGICKQSIPIVDEHKPPKYTISIHTNQTDDIPVATMFICDRCHSRIMH
jgi:hypothetical protein